MLIGLIGGVASGKSTVGKILESLGALRLDSDRAAHQVLNSPAILPELKRLFGENVCDAQGQIDRKHIARQVFGDEPEVAARRRELEGLIHPKVREMLQSEIASAADRYPAIVLDTPLLVEVGWDKQCDHLLFVDTPLELRQRLAMARGWTTEELARREASQVSLDVKRARATDILVNDGSVEQLHQRVTQFWHRVVTPR